MKGRYRRWLSVGRSVAAFLPVLVLSVSLMGYSPTMAGETLDRFALGLGTSVVCSATDPTPPVALLSIPDRGSGAVLVRPGDAPRTIPIAFFDRFFVVGAAQDPDGVQEVTVRGSARTQCTTEAGTGDTRLFENLRALDVDRTPPGGLAHTRRWTRFLVDPQRYPCSEGWYRLVSITITVHVEGKNFAGLTSATPATTFTYTAR